MTQEYEHLLFEDYSVFRLHAQHENPAEHALLRVIDTIVSCSHRCGISPAGPNMLRVPFTPTPHKVQSFVPYELRVIKNLLER